MVYATTPHSPVHDGAPETWNGAEIGKMPGVIGTVRLSNGVAVVAERFEQARAAVQALKVTWKKAKAEGFDSERALAQDYVKVHGDAGARKQMVHRNGDTDAAFAGAAKTFKADYYSDYGYHAQMEPLNAVARFNEAGDHVEIWDGTQAPDRVRVEVAEALGFKLSQVTINQCYMGGGFGRRSLADYTAEAALVAREVKRPVKLIWTREQDFAHAMFRPQTFQCMEAALDGSGKVSRLAPLHRGRWWRADHRWDADCLLRGSQPAHRAPRRLSRHPRQALAGGRACAQRVRHRKLHQ